MGLCIDGLRAVFGHRRSTRKFTFSSLMSGRNRWFWIAILTLLLTLSGHGWLPPLVAQEGQSDYIELDGYQLFKVWSSKDFSAEQRVDSANKVLEDAVQSAEPVTVEIVERNQLPVIQVNERSLLTVTERDAPAGLTPQEQAEIWQRRVQKAINRGQKQRQPQYIWRMLLVSAGCLMLVFAVNRLLSWLWQHRLQRLLPLQIVDPDTGEKKKPQGLQFLLKAVLVLLQTTSWVIALGYISQLFPYTRIWTRRLVDVLRQSLAAPFIPLGEQAYSVLDVIILLALFIGLINLIRVAQSLLRSRVLQRTGMSLGAQEAIAFITHYALLFIGTLVLLQLWGLDLSSLTIFASVLGVGLGLGLQGIAKNFISGLVIIFERPIQVGDFVEVGDLQGTVERINVRSTEIVTLDRVSIIVPNSEFLESRVVNWSHSSPISRLKLPVGVAYGSDCKALRSALIDACKDYPGVLKDPNPRVFFTGFGDSSLDFTLLVWIDQPKRQYEIKSDLYFRIETILRHRQIEIPFPQRDLHLRTNTLSLGATPEFEKAIDTLTHRLSSGSQSSSRPTEPTHPTGDEQT